MIMVAEQTCVDTEYRIQNSLIFSARKKTRFTLFHLTLVTLLAFWLGVIFTNYVLNSPGVHKENCHGDNCLNLSPVVSGPVVDDDTVIDDDEDSEKNSEEVKQSSSNLITRKESDPEIYEDVAKRKLIVLHGNDVWTKYDKWHRYDWRKCPFDSTNCAITTDVTRISESAAVVYNSAKMPSPDDMKNVKDKSLKRVFLSGLTPLSTKFEPSEYDDFFDLTITYKGDSDVRIPYWPNDGLLPAMYRPKPATKVIEGENMLDLEDEIKNYFNTFGKADFLGFTIKSCEDNKYSTLFVRKLREEGLINTYSLNTSKVCIDKIKDTVLLPCKGINTDDCVKHFEKFKFVIVPDEDLCTDYVTRDYWNALFAWEAVPLLYGASDYEKYLIPNSYIDTVGKEEYISPSFKKAYSVSQDSMKYYKTFHLWRHEDRVEKYHWQCELCRKLNKESSNSNKKVKMSLFWNKDKDCGAKLPVHELMRLQLVRTGVIK